MNPPVRSYSGRPSKSEQLERNFAKWKELLCEVFINAVLNHDKAAIERLADAADFFKGKLEDDYLPADPVRLKLIKIRNQPRAFPKIFTLRQMAERVYGKAGIKERGSDFSGLRRMCKELGVPIRPDPKQGKSKRK